MDDLEHEDHLVELWDTQRYRNSRLIAGISKDELVLAQYAIGEVQTILDALRGPNAAAAPAAAEQSINVVMQPDPNADARSQAQLDAFSLSMQR